MELSTVFPIGDGFTDYPDYLDYENWTQTNRIDGESPYTASEVISLLVFSVVFLVGVPGNAVVIWVTAMEVHKTVNSIWFLNLALADLLCCLVLPLLAVPIIRHGDWPFSEGACRFLPSVILLNMYASILLLTAISIDRCMLVMNPIWCQNHRSLSVTWFACLLAWALALVLTIPSMLYRYLEQEFLPPSWSCGVLYKNKSVEVGVAVSRFLFSFLGPLIIISLCYILLLARLWSRHATRSHKTIKVVVAVVVGFFLCWTPYQIVGLMLALNRKGSRLYSGAERFDSLSISLAYINSCINPVIYVVAGHGIKGRMISHSICTKLRSALTEDSVGRDSKSFTRSTMGSTAVPEEKSSSDAV
ncbi:C5a anaphylatoxin chemotactic receptor 1 [Sminthopsis crassicaudata]|uniref:C5a anaphylatoxin chemotactic receptor 1 n=1 Tax=Sminthopsis crassicaudata TaxID=9301 RepID=UPI003D69F9CF